MSPATCRGSSMVKTQPEPGMLRTPRTPPIASTLRRQIDSPSPRAVFSLLDGVTGRNIFSASPGCRPPQLSCTFDQDVIAGGVDVQRDLGVLLRELECVLQQVSDRGEQQVPVGVDCQARIDVGDHQLAAAGLRFQRRGYSYLADELGKGQQLMPRRYPRGHPHVGERAIHEIAQPDQAAIEHGAGRPGEPHVG